ncbi:nuclear transport factor 2 family protein [Microbacterium sp. RD1]|uniref:nuclear transport factor 2 family protein n=1 Tax=Microbacterium sp. RD1 TaxID=3457313 RepID=UPI003FA5E145
MSAAEDIEAVRQLVLQERQGRDRRRWDQMREQYWPDATVHLSWFSGNAYDNVADTARMNANGNVSTHRLSPPYISVVADRAVAELPTVIEAPIRLDDVDAVLHTYLRLEYRAERRDGRWGISQLDTVYERDLIVVATPGQSVSIDQAELARYRRPFRLLAWFLAQRGYEVLDDLLGEDRPDEVEAFYEAERLWLQRR